MECGKNVLLPFTCPYCRGSFCAEHRLPESHGCLFLPREPFWYQKKKSLENREYAHKIRTRKSYHNLKTALVATFVIALLFGASILIPALAGSTQSAIAVVLGILGFFFLIFLLLRYLKQ